MTTASVRVILSSRAAWAAARDADVSKKVWIASLTARNSRADNEICCSGGAVVLGLREYVGAEVLGAEGSRGTEDPGAIGNGVVIVGAGAEDAGI